MSLRRRMVAVLAVAGLALAGCSDPGGGGPVATPDDPILIYGSDGVMQDAFGAAIGMPDVLTGIKGTAPLNQLPTDFTNRLLDRDPSLTGFPYAGETYDAVVISALAAELAGTSDPEVVRGYVNTVTTGSEPCASVASCLELARAGESLAYDGVSLHSGFTDQGEPATGSYATLHFSPEGTIDQAKTEFVGAGDLTAVTQAEPPEPGPRPEAPVAEREPLRFGGLLPASGQLAEGFHDPMAAGAALAVEEINEAGGVLGVDVDWRDGDDGSFDTAVALQTLTDHLAAGVHVLIGPAASGTTQEVLPEAVAAGRIVFSPSSTRADLTAADHDGFFFRTAPPDNLQGEALADVVMRDGGSRVALVAEGGVYGQGLQEQVAEALLRYGIAPEDLTRLSYDPPAGDRLPAPEASRLASEIAAAGPDAVVLLGFTETASVVRAMIDAGLPLAE